MHRRRWHLYADSPGNDVEDSDTSNRADSGCSAAVRWPGRGGPSRAESTVRASPIAATARSERRIAVRRPGVGIDTSSASADPPGGPWRSTARSCQVPGTPRSSTLPRSSKPVPEPTTRSRTVRETRISPAPAWPRIRAAMCTAMPADVGVQQFALAGVDAGADLDAQCLGVSA